MNKKIGQILIVLFGAGLALNSFAQTNSTAGAPTAAIVAATKKFLATLDDAQRGKVVFEFKDEAQRKRWSNLPTIFKRQGLRMGDPTKPQRDAVLAVLAAALSPQGYEKVLQIVEADELLRKSSGGTMFGRDDISVYLINAAQPRFATVQITRQKRNDNQSAGEIEFTFHPFRPKIARSAGPT